MTSRFQILLVAAVGLGLSFAGLEVRDRAMRLDAAAAASRREAREVARLAEGHEAVAAEVVDLERRLGGDSGALLAYANDVARATALGERLRSVSAGGTTEGEGRVEERVEMEVRLIGLKPLVAFLEALEGGRPNILVRTLYLRPSAGAPDLLDATLTVASVRPK